LIITWGPWREPSKKNWEETRKRARWNAFVAFNRGKIIGRAWISWKKTERKRSHAANDQGKWTVARQTRWRREIRTRKWHQTAIRIYKTVNRNGIVKRIGEKESRGENKAYHECVCGFSCEGPKRFDTRWRRKNDAPLKLVKGKGGVGRKREIRAIKETKRRNALIFEEVDGRKGGEKEIRRGN